MIVVEVLPGGAWRMIGSFPMPFTLRWEPRDGRQFAVPHMIEMSAVPENIAADAVTDIDAATFEFITIYDEHGRRDMAVQLIKGDLSRVYGFAPAEEQDQ